MDDDETDDNESKDKRQQAHLLCNVASAYQLGEVLSKVTNGKNILDILYTNATLEFTTWGIPASTFSDHNTIQANVILQDQKQVLDEDHPIIEHCPNKKAKVSD